MKRTIQILLFYVLLSVAFSNVQASSLTMIGTVVKKGAVFVAKNVSEGFLKGFGQELGKQTANNLPNNKNPGYDFLEQVANKSFEGSLRREDNYFVNTSAGTYYDYRGSGHFDIYIESSRVQSLVDKYTRPINDLYRNEVQRYNNAAQVLWDTLEREMRRQSYTNIPGPNEETFSPYKPAPNEKSHLSKDKPGPNEEVLQPYKPEPNERSYLSKDKPGPDEETF